MRVMITSILLILFTTQVMAQSTELDKAIIAGNQFYKEQKFEQAVAEYQKALNLDPNSSTARFNYANALYKAGKQVEATKTLNELSSSVTEKQLRAKSYYNKGVILSAQKNLEESIESYKHALRQDPADKEARENLQKALLELKKKTPPEKQKDQEKKQDKNKQQQKQPQSKLNPREAEQRLKLLAQKEKEVQERLQKEKNKTGGGGTKDW
jgi:Ca-activated chloride channel homolog